MEEILNTLLKTSVATNDLKGHIGKSYGLILGTVSDRDDPEELGRIKAYLPAKGDRQVTDWCMRGVPSPHLSMPVPEVGDTVVLVPRDGDMHKLVYFSVLNNKINPQAGLDDLEYTIKGKMTLRVGNVTITIEDDTVQISAANVQFVDAESIHINDPDKQVATLGALDDDPVARPSPLVTRGWT